MVDTLERIYKRDAKLVDDIQKGIENFPQEKIDLRDAFLKKLVESGISSDEISRIEPNPPVVKIFLFDNHLDLGARNGRLLDAIAHTLEKLPKEQKTEFLRHIGLSDDQLSILAVKAKRFPQLNVSTNEETKKGAKPYLLQKLLVYLPTI